MSKETDFVINMNASEHTEKSMEVKEKHKTSFCNLYSPHARYNKW